jgi:hypothetical protein
MYDVWQMTQIVKAIIRDVYFRKLGVSRQTCEYELEVQRGNNIFVKGSLFLFPYV